MKRARAIPGAWAVLGLILAVARPAPAAQVFPYDVQLETLSNGLRVVTVPVIPSKEISYFTIFRAGESGAADPGDEAEARLFSRIGAEARRVLSGGDFFGDFISFCGRENLPDVVRAEAARVLRLADGPGGAAFTPPETILLVSGDIHPGELLSLVRAAYSGWKSAPGPEPKETPAAFSGARPPVSGMPVPGGVRLVFRGPAFSDREIDKAALDLFAAAFSPSSPIHRKLVDDEKLCFALDVECEDRRGPADLVIRAELTEEGHRPAVESALLAEIGRLRNEGLSSRFLADAVSGKKAALAVSLASTGGMARVLAHYLGLTGDPASIDRFFALYDRITPLDVRAMVRKYLGSDPSPVSAAKRRGR